MNRLRSLFTVDNYSKLVGTGIYLGAGSGIFYGITHQDKNDNLEDKVMNTVACTAGGMFVGGFGVALLPFTVAAGIKLTSGREDYYRFDDW